jgi:hypothetical protein
VGEHGTSSVFLWSSARIGGMRVQDMLAERRIAFDEFRKAVEHDVRYANITIIEGIGASQYGIGMVAGRVAEVVLRDERAVFPVGSAAQAARPAPAKPEPRKVRFKGKPHQMYQPGTGARYTADAAGYFDAAPEHEKPLTRAGCVQVA